MILMEKCYDHHHKDPFNIALRKDIPSPKWLSFTKKEEALNYAKECEYPIIVKANDKTGDKGILRAGIAVKQLKMHIINMEKRLYCKPILLVSSSLSRHLLLTEK